MFYTLVIAFSTNVVYDETTWKENTARCVIVGVHECYQILRPRHTKSGFARAFFIVASYTKLEPR